MDNLSQISQKVNSDIDPNGAPESILAQNHNDILQMFLRASGKYMGLPYMFKSNYQNLIDPGELFIEGALNAIDLVIYVSPKTTDGTDFIEIINNNSLGDFIHLKDYVGRSSYFTITQIEDLLDLNADQVFKVSLKPFASNINYTYQSNEENIGVVELLNISDLFWKQDKAYYKQEIQIKDNSIYLINDAVVFPFISNDFDQELLDGKWFLINQVFPTQNLQNVLDEGNTANQADGNSSFTLVNGTFNTVVSPSIVQVSTADKQSIQNGDAFQVTQTVDGRQVGLGLTDGLKLKTNASGGSAFLKSNLVTATRNFEFPNESGTLATEAFVNLQKQMALTVIDSYNGTRLSPADTNLNGYFVSKASNQNVGFYAQNTDNVSNASQASLTVKGTGALYTNYIGMSYYNNGYYVAHLKNSGALFSDKKLTIMNWNNNDIDFRTGSAFASTTSKFLIKSNGAINMPITPTKDNSQIKLLARNSSGDIVEIDAKFANETGWSQHSDSQYTVGSPLVINAGTSAVLTNNNTSSITTHLPFGITTFLNANKITPIKDGDFYAIEIRFKAKSSSPNGRIKVKLDIGGAQGVIREEREQLEDGSGVEQAIAIPMFVYSGSTFVSNGGEIKIDSLVGNTSIYDITFIVCKCSSSKT